jgi:hypothetical protein
MAERAAQADEPDDGRNKRRLTMKLIGTSLVLLLAVAMGGCAIQNDAAANLSAANALSVDVLAVAMNNPTLPGVTQMVADANAALAIAVKLNTDATAWPTPEQFAADTALGMQIAEEIMAFILKYFPAILPASAEHPKMLAAPESTPQAVNAQIQNWRIRMASKRPN